MSLVVRFHFESQSGLYWFCFTSLHDVSRKLTPQLGQSEKNCPNPWPYKNIQFSTFVIVFLVFWLVQSVPVISSYNGLRYVENNSLKCYCAEFILAGRRKKSKRHKVRYNTIRWQVSLKPHSRITPLDSKVSWSRKVEYCHNKKKKRLPGYPQNSGWLANFTLKVLRSARTFDYKSSALKSIRVA